MPDGQPISWHQCDEGLGLEPGYRIVEIDARAGQVCLRGELHVADMHASLVDLVPSARILADELVEQITADFRSHNQPISCKAGCAACCRYLIPASPPESVALWLGLLHLPGPHREKIMGRFLDIMQRIDDNPVPDMAGLDEDTALQALSDWYTSLDTVCPLLEDNLCSVYPYRPLACRECITLCSPDFCADPQAGVGERVALPFSIAEVLYETAGIMMAHEPESVILTTLPSWIRTGSEPYDQSWPAIDVARCFAATLHRQADEANLLLIDRADEWSSAASA